MANWLKKISLFTVCVAAVVTVVLTVTWKKQYYEVAGVNLKGQKMTNWCWAASTQMVGEFLTRRQSPQKEIVNFQIKKLTPKAFLCYKGPYDSTLSEYNQTLNFSNFDFFNRYFDSLQYTCRLTAVRQATRGKPSNLDSLWRVLKNELISNKPFIISGLQCQSCHIWNGHMMVATGFLQKNKERWLVINDPWKLCTGCNYYLNYNSFGRDNAGSGEINGNTIQLIHNFQNKQQPGMMQRLIETAENGLHFIESLSTNLRQSKQRPSAVSRRIIPLVYESTAEPQNYFVQVVHPENTARNYTFTLSRDADKKDFWVSSIQKKCFFVVPIPSVLTNVMVQGNRDVPDLFIVSFDFQGQRFTANLDNFNALISRGKITPEKLKEFTTPFTFNYVLL